MEERLAELGILAALGLGVVLGLRHSLDPDHVVAISGIVNEYQNPLRAIWVGVSWGLGHSASLLMIGIVVVSLRLAIPDRLALGLEFLVGLMLIGLGAQVVYKLRNKRELQRHHSHTRGPDQSQHNHEIRSVGRPFLRKKSFLVGTVHGLAGSAALTLLVLATIDSPLTGMVYILLFGLGSVLSMGIMTIFISFPFFLSAKRLPSLDRFLQGGVGALSIFFGGFLIYEIGFVDGLF